MPLYRERRPRVCRHAAKINKSPRQLLWRGEFYLVSYFWLKFLGLINHLLYLARGRNTATDVELSVDLLKLRLQILSHTMTELLNGVDASLLKQLCKLWANAIDTEKVGMVRPAQNQFHMNLLDPNPSQDPSCLCAFHYHPHL